MGLTDDLFTVRSTHVHSAGGFKAEDFFGGRKQRQGWRRRREQGSGGVRCEERRGEKEKGKAAWLSHHPHSVFHGTHTLPHTPTQIAVLPAAHTVGAYPQAPSLETSPRCVTLHLFYPRTREPYTHRAVAHLSLTHIVRIIVANRRRIAGLAHIQDERQLSEAEIKVVLVPPHLHTHIHRDTDT